MTALRERLIADLEAHNTGTRTWRIASRLGGKVSVRTVRNELNRMERDGLARREVIVSPSNIIWHKEGASNAD